MLVTNYPKKQQKYGYSKITILLLGSFLLISQPCGAQDIFKMSLEELLEIKITTVSKKTESILDSPAPVRVLSQADIAILGFSTLEQTLNYFTGVSSINGEGNIFTTYTIRGNTQVNFNTNTLLLLDGQPIYSPYHGSFDMAAIPLIMIERIEMIPGAQSVFYGTNAINAVINIISKNSSEHKGQTKIRSGSFGGYIASTHQSFSAFKGNADIAIELTGEEGETLRLMDESGRQVTLEDGQDIASTSFGWKNQNWTIRINRYQRRLDNYRTREFDTRQVNKEQGWSSNLSYLHPWYLGKMKVSLNYQDWQLVKTFFPLNNDPSFDWNYSSQLAIFQLEQDLDISENHHALAGFSLDRGRARRFKQNINEYDIGQFDQPTDSRSLFWNGDIDVNEFNRLFYGARYSVSEFWDGELHQTIRLSNLSPRIGWINRYQPKGSFKLLYSEAFRVPTYFEKQVSSEQVSGNSNLKPETSQSLDFVWLWIGDHWQLELNPFMMRIKDKITRVDLDVPPDNSDFGRRQNQNVGTIKIYGIETTARFSFNSELNGVLGFGLYRGENETLNQSLPFTYRSMLHGLASSKISDQWRIEGSFKWLNDWGEAQSNLLINVDAKYKLSGFENAHLEFRIENLLQETVRLPEIGRENSQVPTIPETEERKFYIGVSFEY